eukprot:TRINITY_DN9439_c0_g1_i1.p1 TRINITY_DN9439_c0_g1~~TRINITY_DN9439_c0_g1_i1.p1  ORF type:complete len:549 (+),score=156.11 TRINITY_DN9439_c0_g1_i1:90-1736(+)
MEALGRAFGVGEQQHVEISDEAGFCERMKNALCGMICGVLLFIGACVMLGWNEKRAVYTARTIDKARDDMVQLETCVPDAKYNGKLIAIMGCGIAPGVFPSGGAPGKVTDATMTRGLAFNGDSPTTDSDAPGAFSRLTNLGYVTDALGWTRDAWQYAYQEQKHTSTTTDKKTKKKRTVTTYSYSRGWVTFGSSLGFSNPSGESACSQKYSDCREPRANWPPAFQRLSFKVDRACIGSSNDSCTPNGGSGQWSLGQDSWGDSALNSLGDTRDLTIQSNADSVAGSLYKFKQCGNYINTIKQVSSRLWSTCDNPVANADASGWGDYRWEWTVRRAPATVSVLAQQKEISAGKYQFVEWQNPDYSDCSYCTIGEAEGGSTSGDQFLDELGTKNTVLSWVLRFVGFFMMWCGMQLCVAPISLAPEAVPVVGEYIGALIGKILFCATCCCSAGFSLAVIAIAWLAFRPMIGIPLLLVCCCSMAGVSYLAYYKHSEYKRFKQPDTAQELGSSADYQGLQAGGDVPGGYPPPGPPGPPGGGWQSGPPPEETSGQC